MEDKVCLDTDVLVNFLRNKAEEVGFIAENEGGKVFSTTYINLFELYFGAYKSGVGKNVDEVDEIARRLRILNLSPDSVKSAGEILARLEKKGVRIDFRDLLIGCIAKKEGYAMKTGNSRHFERIDGLLIV